MRGFSVHQLGGSKTGRQIKRVKVEIDFAFPLPASTGWFPSESGRGEGVSASSFEQLRRNEVRDANGMVPFIPVPPSVMAMRCFARMERGAEN